MGANVARFDDGVREHFLEFLERHYPALVPGYLRLYTTSNAPKRYRDAVKRTVSDLRATP